MNTISLPNPWQDPLTLPTDREGVVLHQLTIEDVPYFFDAWTHSERDIARYDPDTIGTYDSIEEVEASMYELGRLKMGTWDGDKFVGSGNLYPGKEIGVWLLSFWTDSRETSNGYGSLTAQALVRYADEHLPVLRAVAMDENTHSVRILEKLGLERTGKNVGRFALFEKISSVAAAPEIPTPQTPARRGAWEKFSDGQGPFPWHLT